MKNRKGFTLIELLAVIVILAIIALIAVPQVIKILNQARRSAAEDSTYGIYNATQDYISKFMIDNGGDFPGGELTFTCDNTSCKLDNYSTLVSEGYKLEETLDYKGKKATGGTIKVTNGGTDIVIENLVVSGFYCNHNGDRAICENKKSVITSYGYAIAVNDENPNSPVSLSSTRPIDKKIYLRYILKDGEVDNEILPEICLYSDNYSQKELCLTINEFEESNQKILDYFGYDENTWTWDNYAHWKDLIRNIDCSIYDDSDIRCQDSSILAESCFVGYVYVSATNPNGTNSCYFSEDGRVNCYYAS